MSDKAFDVVVIGAGVIGLAHAYTAASRGLKVAVVERHARAVGASIRNFGFVTVTGQQRGDFWNLTRRTRDIWADIAPKAGITVQHRGLYMAVRRSQSVDLLKAFLQTEMGEGCALLSPSEVPGLAGPELLAVLHSPHEVRVESRDAIPALADWMARDLGVTFFWSTEVTHVETGHVVTARGELKAGQVFVCPGDDAGGLFAQTLQDRAVSRCKLQMLRLADPGFRLPGAVMSDLGLVRYLGYADLPEADAVRAVLKAEQAEHLDNGVHLIVVQSGDGSLVVGDSHHYHATPDPFGHTHVDALILDEYRQVMGEPPAVLERWTGTYAVSPQGLWFHDTVCPGVHLVMVTCGAGASSAFGIAERVVGQALEMQNEKVA